MVFKKVDSSNIFINILVYIIFLCIYILPTNYFEQIGYPVTKLIYISFICILYLIMLKKIYIREILFICGIIGLSFLLKSIDVFQFIGIVVLYKITNYKDKIKKVLMNSPIVWIALFATIIYSVVYFGDGRLLHTSIKEVNQSGLAIFCLALIIKKRNVSAGILVFILGIFTLSRTYLLAVLFFIIMNFDILKSKIITKKLIKRTSFLKLLILSSIGLIVIAFMFESMYKNGDLYTYNTEFIRLFSINDMSNYFRFVTNKNLITIFLENPKFMLKGITENEFALYSMSIATKLGQAYRYTNPHNFFFSYLKLYGVFSIFVFAYISRILSEIVSKENYSIYISLVTYAIFLSVGFNHYWVYLSWFTLILYEKDW